MYIGISTGCFYPQFTDISLKNVVDTGVKYTEIFFNTDSELEEEYLLKLKQIADEKGVIWIYGIGVAHRCAINEKSKKILIIKTEKD